jgi:hypothetical protein
MTLQHHVASREGWPRARLELLAAEKECTRQRDASILPTSSSTSCPDAAMRAAVNSRWSGCAGRIGISAGEGGVWERDGDAFHLFTDQ